MNDDSPDAERARALMMAALDGEISPQERRELDGMLAASTQLAAEWRRLSRVKDVTAGMTLERLPEEVWDRYWRSVYRRTERGLAWILISAGVVVLAGYWLWHTLAALLTDTTLPPVIRFALFALLLGGAILLVSVARERLFTHRRDPYKEVAR